MNRRQQVAAVAAVLAVAGAFAASLALPVVVGGDPTARSGWVYLTNGWMGPAAGQCGWWANPLLAAWPFVLFRSPGRAIRLALLALGVASLSLTLMHGVPDPLIGGRTHPFVRFDVGFGVWLVAYVAAILGSAVVWGLRDRPPESDAIDPP